jgi:hypothetical protein
VTELVEILSRASLIGVGATIVMDVWALALKIFFKIQPLNWAMVGRWLGHFPKGQFVHTGIGTAAPVPGELVIGWLAHYLTGIIFSILLLLLLGMQWANQPTPLPAMLFGLATVLFPFLIMQPGLGAGIAASKTPNPNQARLRSLLTHAVFGVGLYCSTLLTAKLIGN